MKMRRLSRLRALPVVLLWTGVAFAQSSALSYVEYQGQRIELNRTYVDLDGYKEDVRNISSKQASQVEALMRKVRFGPAFANAKALNDALFTLQFPGYGLFYANQLGAHIDTMLELAYVEIPLRDRNRYFVLEKTPTQGFRVISDFVATSIPEITRVHRAKGATLEFSNSNGKKIFPKLDQAPQRWGGT